MAIYAHNCRGQRRVYFYSENFIYIYIIMLPLTHDLTFANVNWAIHKDQQSDWRFHRNCYFTNWLMLVWRSIWNGSDNLKVTTFFELYHMDCVVPKIDIVNLGRVCKNFAIRVTYPAYGQSRDLKRYDPRRIYHHSKIIYFITIKMRQIWILVKVYFMWIALKQMRYRLLKMYYLH